MYALTFDILSCLVNEDLWLQVKAPQTRAKFSPEDFAKHYNMGEPLALLYFKAVYQDNWSLSGWVKSFLGSLFHAGL